LWARSWPIRRTAPTEVLDYLAEQLGIADPSCVKAYRVREMTRLGHAREIRVAYGFVEFAGMQDELVRWVADRAWTSGDGPMALFDGSVAWLRERRVLLPGVSTLARLVARVRGAAMQRLWETLSGLLTAQQARALELLLEVPEGARASDLERLRRGPTRVSGKAMVAALDRVSEIRGLGVGGVDLGRRSTAEGAARRDVVELGVGADRRHAGLCGNLNELSYGFGRVTVSSRGRHQSVADLDDVTGGRPFKAHATDSQTVGANPDLVVAKRALFAALLGGAQKAADSREISVKRIIRRPRVALLGCAITNVLGLHLVDRVQVQSCRTAIHEGTQPRAHLHATEFRRSG